MKLVRTDRHRGLCSGDTCVRCLRALHAPPDSPPCVTCGKLTPEAAERVRAKVAEIRARRAAKA